MLKALTRLSYFIVPVAMVLLFQNCSGGGFNFISTYKTEDFASASAVPVLTISQSPDQLTSLRSSSFAFQVTTNKFASVKAISCSMDGALAVDCTNGFAPTNLVDGDHTLRVRAEDSLGNKSDEIVFLWKVDGTKPVVTINQSPAAVVGSTNVGFSFSSSENSTFMCAMDSEVMSVCASPVTRTVTDGNHTFRVQAVDAAKNISDVMLSSFKVDLTAPIINVVTKPLSLASSSSAAFTFNGTDDGAAISIFSCKLDSQAAAACNAGSVTYTNLAEGAHTFSVSGQDSAGNMSAATTYSWSIDATAPSIPTITANVASPTKSNTATFMFSATDTNGVKSYECQLDSGAITSCLTTGVSYTALASGAHTFKVRAIDSVGNTSGFANFAWTVDLTPPVVTLSQTPASSTTDTSASFGFTTSDVGAGVKSVECQMDSGAFAACTSPKTYSGLTVGSHIFNVRATDQVSNTTTQSYSWTISAAATPTPTPTPAMSPTPTPTPTATPSPTPSPTATPPNPTSNSLDTMKPGTWAEIANSKLQSVVYSGSYASALYGNSGPNAIMNAWAGGVLDTVSSQLLVWGGGHQDYFGNEMYSFSLNTLKWTRLTEPSNPSGWSGFTGVMPDGAPSAPHTYDGQVFLPTLNKMFFVGGMDKSGGVYNNAWTFDPSTKVWSRKPDYPCGNIGYGQVAGYDSNTKNVYVASNSAGDLCEYNPATNTWKQYGSSSLPDYHMSGDLDPVGKRLVAVGSGRIIVYNLTGTIGSTSKPATTGDRTVETNGNAPGFVWYPPAKVFVGWTGGKNIYTLDPATWVWTLRTLDASNAVTPTAPNGQGTFGRFQYDPTHNVFIVVNAISQNVFVFKPNF